MSPGSRPLPPLAGPAAFGADPHTLLYLSRGDVERADVPLAALREAVRDAFAEKGRGRIDSPPKREICPRPDSSLRDMKAYVPALDAAGMKWIAGYPGNVARGLPTITGLIVLNDAETGLPRAVMDCTWITSMRTAACTAVAAALLARPESETLGVVACGQQGRTNLRALHGTFPLRRVRAYDRDAAAARHYAAEMAAELDLEVEPVARVEDAVRGCDLVVTSTPIRKVPEPVLGPGLLAEGSFAAALDFDSAFDTRAFAEADRIVVDDAAQLRHFRETGYFRDTPEPHADLGDVVAGLAPGRTRADERIVALNLGIGFLDVVAATLVAQAAEAKGIGQRLPLFAPSAPARAAAV